MVQNGPKWSKLSKWSEAVKMSNGQKWGKWLELVKNDHKWSKWSKW